MGRRGNNEGSIFQRKDGRWVAQLTLPDGKYKYYYAKTQTEATRRLIEARQNVQKGLPLPPERQTVAQYLIDWLKTRQS